MVVGNNKGSVDSNADGNGNAISNCFSIATVEVLLKEASESR